MENKNYLMYDKVFSQRDEKENDFEEILPEYMPGIERIVFARAIPVVRYERIEDGVLQLGVRCVYKVMFVSDYRKQLKCNTFTKDMEFSFNVRKSVSESDTENGGTTFGFIPDCNAVCTYISAKPAGTRRMNIRAGIAVNAALYSPVYEQLPDICDDGGEKGLVCLEKQIPTVEISGTEGGEVRIIRELALEEGMPAIAEIVDASVEMCVCKVAHEAQRATATGNAVFRALYRTEDDTYVTLVQDFPFSGEIFSSDTSEGECAYKVSVTPVSVTADNIPDNYGENRVISLGITATLGGIRYGAGTATLYEDAFCRGFDCRVNTKPYPAKRLAGVLEESFSMNGAINSRGKEIERIIESNAVVCSASTEFMENKAVVNFKLGVSVLGVSPTGEIVFTEGIVPFTAVFGEELKNIVGNPCFDTCVCVSSVSCEVSSGEIKCNAGVCIRSIVTESMDINGVSEVEIDVNAASGRNANEFIVYYPLASDTVWSVAKKYRISPESLRSANKISGNGFDKRTVVIPME